MKNVYVHGVAVSCFGELWEASPRTLVSQVVNEALVQSNLSILDIDAIYIGNMLSGILGRQENLGALFAEELQFSGPAIKVEGACASGGLAVYTGALGIKSGEFRHVLIIGVEKMTDHDSSDVAAGLMAAASDDERRSGATFPALYAFMAQAYLDKYGVSEQDLALVSVKNHYHATLNPKSQFKKQITVDKVMQSPYVAEPLKVFDCAPISDGAAAVVLSSQRSEKLKAVSIVGSGVATSALGLQNRSALTSIPSSKQAAKKAYAQAGLAPRDIDVAEVHDCFSIAEIMACEDLGLYKPGSAVAGLKNDETKLGSKKCVVNTSGGLKACGHPVGATGVKQVAEIVNQLRGEADKRQVSHAKIGLTHNVGGTGAVAVVHIFKSNL